VAGRKKRDVAYLLQIAGHRVSGWTSYVDSSNRPSLQDYTALSIWRDKIKVIRLFHCQYGLRPECYGQFNSAGAGVSPRASPFTALIISVPVVFMPPLSELIMPSSMHRFLSKNDAFYILSSVVSVRICLRLVFGSEGLLGAEIRKTLLTSLITFIGCFHCLRRFFFFSLVFFGGALVTYQ